MLSTEAQTMQTTSGRYRPPVVLQVVEVLGSGSSPPPEAGARLAGVVIEQLQDPDTRVILEFTGVTGMTTAFGNTLFDALFASYAPEQVRQRVEFKALSALQREVLRRSLHAARQAGRE